MSVAFHVLSLVHSVESLEASVCFFRDALAMPVRIGGDGWATVDNGSVALRLEARGPSPQPLVLELSSHDLDSASAALLEYPGVERLGGVEWVTPSRQEMRLAARAHGLELVLARTYDEDELGVVPVLPTRLPWAPRAMEVVQTLLRDVPVVFRVGARAKITERAEYLTVLDGEVEVTVLHGVRAVVQVTPAFQLERLRRSLVDLDFDPAGWDGDFEREP